MLNCACPFTINRCESALDCEAVYYVAADVADALDTNGDGVLNLGDA